GAFDLFRRQHRTALPGAVDHEGELPVGIRRLRGGRHLRHRLLHRRLLHRHVLRRGLPDDDLFHGRLLHGGLLRSHLLRRRLLSATHLRASPSILASRASRSRAHAASPSGCLSSPVTRNTSSARAPKVAMRASCTRRPWLRSTWATSASSPGRSVLTRLSTVAAPSPLVANSTCGTMRKWRRCRGCVRCAGRTRSKGPASTAPSLRATTCGSASARVSSGSTWKLSNTA